MSRVKIRQDVGRLRGAAYDGAGEQLDALWKIVRAILPHLPPEAVKAIPKDALDVMERVDSVKARFPKRR